MVTGGAGFIGSNLVHLLLKNPDNQVLTIDKLTYAGSLENINDTLNDPRSQFELIDIVDKVKIKDIFDRYEPDIIFHLAAESHVDRSIDGADEFIITNVLGTQTLLDASLTYWQSKNSPPEFRFIHISTDEVYGSLGTTGFFNESCPYQPNSPYAASKASSDMIVRAYYQTFGLPIIITNCSNNYGPYQYPEKLIPLCILNALDEKPLPVYGDGQQIRDWLSVIDHVEALELISASGKIGETYCIGGNNEQHNIDIVKSICQTLDTLKPRETNASYEDLITFVDDRPGHDKRYAVDANKIKQEIGWEPKVSFNDGLQNTIEWYINHQEWVNHIHKKNQDARDRRGLKS